MKSILLTPVFVVGMLTIACAEPTAWPITETQATLQIMEVRDHFKSDRDSIKAKVGHRFVAIEIKVDNSSGNSEVNINPLFFQAKDNQGYTYDTDLRATGAIEPSLPAAEVEAKDIVRGWIVIEIPTDVTLDKLKLKYNVLDFRKTKWMPLH